MSDETPEPNDDIKKRFSAEWPPAMKALHEVAVELGIKLPKELIPDNLDGDDKIDMNTVINNTIERYPDHAEILNALNKEIQS